MNGPPDQMVRDANIGSSVVYNYQHDEYVRTIFDEKFCPVCRGISGHIENCELLEVVDDRSD